MKKVYVLTVFDHNLDDPTVDYIHGIYLTPESAEEEGKEVSRVSLETSGISTGYFVEEHEVQA